MSWLISVLHTGQTYEERRSERRRTAEWLPSTSEQIAYMDLGDEDTIGCVTDMDQLKELMIAFCQQQFGL